MESLLSTLRAQTPQPSPAKFLGWNFGCRVEYYDDTPVGDPSKALSTATFDPETARRKQAERCAVCFSLQAFEGPRTREHLLVYHNLGVDIDLIPAPERAAAGEPEIDRRKDEYLALHLRASPLRPHWLIETAHGFHAVFRVMPLRDPARIREAEEVTRRMVAVLRGNPYSALLTQCLRVPGTCQFKNPDRPFLCRLLMDSADVIPPYELDWVRGLLDAWEVFHDVPAFPRRTRTEALTGVSEARWTARAVVVGGALLARLPERLWETGGWDGLKEWNDRNPTPLPEPELRRVFERIVGRERGKRGAATKRDGRTRPSEQAKNADTQSPDRADPLPSPPEDADQ